ncbi:MAG TPA: MFS transporter, partial [Ktedonobacteraceae bacterium]|nr:MFS transporter [Ktedonobacteraceae bacterium]
MKQQETEPTKIETTPSGAALLASAQRDDREQAGKWAVLGIVAIGVFMATLDSSIVNISLPSIAKYFGVPLNGAVSWIIIAY